MRTRYALLFAIAFVSLLGARPAAAQFEKDWKDWYGQVAIGYSMPQGDAGDVIDDDFWWTGGATYYPDDWPLGIMLELGYGSYSILDEVLEPIQPPDTHLSGDVDVWSLDASAVWSARTSGSFGFYAVGGVGAYYVDARLSEPGVWQGIICDPWFWWCYPGYVPGQIVLASESTTKFGYNLGLGVTFEVGTSSEIYLEARYHSIDTKTTTELLPIVVGYRW